MVSNPITQDRTLANLTLLWRDAKSLLEIIHIGIWSDKRNNICSNPCGIFPIPLLMLPLIAVVGHSVPS